MNKPTTKYDYIVVQVEWQELPDDMGRFDQAYDVGNNPIEGEFNHSWWLVTDGKHVDTALWTGDRWVLENTEWELELYFKPTHYSAPVQYTLPEVNRALPVLIRTDQLNGYSILTFKLHNDDCVWRVHKDGAFYGAFEREDLAQDWVIERTQGEDDDS